MLDPHPPKVFVLPLSKPRMLDALLNPNGKFASPRRANFVSTVVKNEPKMMPV